MQNVLRFFKNRLDWMLVAAVALAVPVILLTSVFSGQLPGTHDAQLHLHRLINAALNLREGIVWPRWGPHLHFGYGYPIGDFYAPGWHVLGGMLVALGVGAVPVWLLAQTIGILLYPVGGYLFGRQIAGRTGALLGAAVFLYAPFRFYEVFAQGNLSQFIAMGLTAWVLWAFARCARTPRPGTIATAAALFAALIVIHHPTAFVFVPFAGLYAVLAAWAAPDEPDKALSRRRRLMATLAAYGLGLALAAIYWLPALVESKYIQLQQVESGLYQIQVNFSPLNELLGPNLPQDRAALNPPRPFNSGQAQLVFGALGLIVALWPRSSLNRWQRIHAIAGGLTMIGTLYLITYHSLWLWEAIPVFKLILFPWRYMGIVTVAAIPGAAVLLDSIPALQKSDQRWKLALLAISLVAVIVTALPAMVPVYPNVQIDGPVTPATSVQYEIDSGNLGAVATYEYTPIWSTKRPLTDACPSCYEDWKWAIRPLKSSIPDGVNITTADGSRVSGTRFDITATQAFTLTLHQFYFPGWTVTVDGQNAEIGITKPEGLMTIQVPQGSHTLEVWYDGTPSQHAGDVISLIALGICGLLWGRQRALGKIPAPSPSIAEESPRTMQFGVISAAIVIVFGVLNAAYLVPSTNLIRPSGSVDKPLNVAVPLSVTFRDKAGTPRVELIGMDISGDTIAQGEWKTVRLYWHSLGTLPENLHTSLKLQDPALGTAWLNSDNAIPGGFNTANWPTDRYVVDTHMIQWRDDVPPYVGNLAVSIYAAEGNDSSEQFTPDAAELPTLRVINERYGKDSGGQCAVPSDAVKVTVHYGDLLTLTGYTLASSADANGKTALTLYWKTHRASPAEVAVFIHMMQGDQVAGTGDTSPIAGYPSTRWLADQCLNQRYDLDVPANTARILVGYYDRSSVAQLTAVSDSGTLEGNGLVIPAK